MTCALKILQNGLVQYNEKQSTMKKTYFCVICVIKSHIILDHNVLNICELLKELC